MNAAEHEKLKQIISACRKAEVGELRLIAYGPVDTTSHGITHIYSGSMSLMVKRETARELIAAWTKLLDETE